VPYRIWVDAEYVPSARVVEPLEPDDDESLDDDESPEAVEPEEPDPVAPCADDEAVSAVGVPADVSPDWPTSSVRPVEVG
jgi:hypothetical protein